MEWKGEEWNGVEYEIEKKIEQNKRSEENAEPTDEIC